MFPIDSARDAPTWPSKHAGSPSAPAASTAGPCSATTGTDLTPRGALLLVLALVAIGGFLRLRGIDFLLPHRLVGDERTLVSRLDLMRHPERIQDHDAHYAFYPHLVSRIAWLCAPRDRPLDARTLEEHLALAAADPLLVRRTVACLSLLVIPATYLLARLFFGRALSLCAAALMTGSLLHLWYSAQARPHGAVTGFMVLGVLGAAQVARRGDGVAYLLAGAMIGLAVATLQTGASLVPVLIFAHLLRPAGTRRAGAWLAVALAMIAASFLAFYPYLFMWDAAAGDESASRAGRWVGSMPIGPDAFDGSGFAVLASSLWHFDPWILLFALVGLAGLAARAVATRRGQPPVAAPRGTASLLRRVFAGREQLAVVAAHALGCLLFFGMYTWTVQRYAIPLLPYLACLAVAGVCFAARGLATLVRRPRAAPRIALALAVTAALLQVATAAWISTLRARPDTLELAASWIAAHLERPRDRIAILPTLDLPLPREPSGLFDAERGQDPMAGSEWGAPWLRYQITLPPDAARAPGWRIFPMPLGRTGSLELARRDPAAYLSALEADYVVIEVWNRPILDELRAELRARHTLAARFAPPAIDRGDDRPFLWRDQHIEYDEAFCWAWRALGMRALGTVVEIYRLSRSAVDGGDGGDGGARDR